MSEDKQTLDDELEATAGEAEQVAEELEATAAEAMEAVAAEAQEAEAEVEVTEVAEAYDEKVEAAVKHVAEEAQAGEAEKTERKRRERRSKQARVAKGAGKDVVEDAPKPARATAQAAGGALGTPAWIAISVACLALGLVLGRFVLGGGGTAGSASFSGKTTVSEAELDNPFATYVYDGQTETITVREAIEQAGAVSSALQDDGTYTLPSAEAAVSAARNAIIDKEADNRGITVSDEDLAAFAEQALGTSDYDAIASTYGMDADAVKALLMSSARMSALRDEVVGTDAPEMPEAPATPEEGKESEATKEYAEYVIGLAGDEWDADKGAWVAEDGAYATALDGYEFSADKATYDAAQAAYYVAYQQYSTAQTELSNTWTDFVNGLLSNASIQVSSLVS